VGKSSDPRVRTVRLATRAYLFSITSPEAVVAPTLEEALARVPLQAEVVLNLDEIELDVGKRVAAILEATPRLSWLVRPAIVVSADPTVRNVFEQPALRRLVLVESSLEDALRYVVGRQWLSSWADFGS
jgi:hypothetical protein